jgi:hypothetical protein
MSLWAKSANPQGMARVALASKEGLMALNFTDLDAQRNRLEGAHPGWHVWYVPHQGGITWCAQPTPILNEASAEDLEKAIHETETDWQNEGVRSG